MTINFCPAYVRVIGNVNRPRVFYLHMPTAKKSLIIITLLLLHSARILNFHNQCFEINEEGVGKGLR